jgi:hypothetical protein
VNRDYTSDTRIVLGCLVAFGAGSTAHRICGNQASHTTCKGSSHEQRRF